MDEATEVVEYEGYISVRDKSDTVYMDIVHKTVYRDEYASEEEYQDAINTAVLKAEKEVEEAEE